MANGAPILERISGAMEQLRETVNACWLDFFQPKTPETNERDGSRAHGVSQMRYLIPTGTYAAGVWSHGDEIRLVCMGNNSPPIFWRYLAEVLGLEDLEQATKSGKMELSAAKYSKVRSELLGKVRDLSRTSDAGSKLHLHYCPIPKSFDATALDTELISAYPRRVHSVSVEENLDMVRDMQQLAADMKTKFDVNRELFVSQYRVLRGWAEANGLLGPQLGFLSSMDLLWMLHGALMATLSARSDDVADSLEETLLRRFFEYFASRCLPSGDVDNLLAGITSPTIKRMNENITFTSKQTIVTTIHSTLQDWTHDSEMRMASMTPRDGFQRFLGGNYHFLKVDCQFWGDTLKRKVEWANVVNDNLKLAMRYLHNKFNDAPGRAPARLWPMPLTDGTNEGRIFFAIGLGTLNSGANETALYEETALRLVDDAFIFDRTKGDILIAIAGSNDFEGLRLQGEGADSQEVASTFGSLAFRPAREAPSSSSQDDNTAISSLGGLPIRSAGQRSSPSTRFRTTEEAIGRLRHDPVHENIEYEVGYEDRFEGLKWIDLEDWGSKATEEEDFIPLHRVVQLRRREDEVVVWDRETRTDRTDSV